MIFGCTDTTDCAIAQSVSHMRNKHVICLFINSLLFMVNLFFTSSHSETAHDIVSG